MVHHRPSTGSAGVVFHVMNRGVRRWRLFDSDLEYQVCLQILGEALERHPAEMFAYCLMPNHFHLVVRPVEDGQLSKLMQWFSGTHSRRWHLRRGTTGTGSVYQGRFKAFPVQTDDHFLTVCRYVERNPLRALLVANAEDWRWSSLSHRTRHLTSPFRLAEWPVECPSDWMTFVNAHEPNSEIARLRQSLGSNVPFGAESWVEWVAPTLGLRSKQGRRGRTKK